MNKIMVEIYLPAAGKSYDVRIPASSRIGEIIPLVEICLAELEEGYFVTSKDTVLCDKNTGMTLDVNLTPSEMGILNGTKLMMI